MPKKSSDYYLKAASSLGWGERSANLDRERITLLKEFVKGEKVLDVGCGYGYYVDFLTNLGFNSYGVDFVSEFIKKAKRGKKGTFVLGSAEKLPFKDKQFDTVILFNILEHVDDKKILLEVKRVSKERIIVVVPREVDESLKQSGVIFRHYLDKSHLREYRPKSLEMLAKQTGLKVVDLRPVHPLYNETIFSTIFGGDPTFKKIVRKIVLLTLPKNRYYTEFWAVFDLSR